MNSRPVSVPDMNQTYGNYYSKPRRRKHRGGFGGGYFGGYYGDGGASAGACGGGGHGHGGGGGGCGGGGGQYFRGPFLLYLQLTSNRWRRLRRWRRWWWRWRLKGNTVFDFVELTRVDRRRELRSCSLIWWTSAPVSTMCHEHGTGNGRTHYTWRIAESMDKRQVVHSAAETIQDSRYHISIIVIPPVRYFCFYLSMKQDRMHTMKFFRSKTEQHPLNTSLEVGRSG